MSILTDISKFRRFCIERPVSVAMRALAALIWSWSTSSSSAMTSTS